ncbi:MAG: hypothetical protein JNM80_00430 [Phycisphaerae bacterium]|nr:hypothetical protein [Phycisphaerae bacterium]
MSLRPFLLAAVGLSLATVGLALAQQRSRPPQSSSPEPRPPMVQWIGHESKHPAGFVVVRDDEAWRALWGKHTGRPADDRGAMHRYIAPRIDFERCMVVGHFAGPSVNADGEVAASVRETAEHLVIRFVSSTFQSAGPGGGGANTTPFGLWVVPASSLPILIEEGRHGGKQGALVWEEAARLPGK